MPGEPTRFEQRDPLGAAMDEVRDTRQRVEAALREYADQPGTLPELVRRISEARRALEAMLAQAIAGQDG